MLISNADLKVEVKKIKKIKAEIFKNEKDFYLKEEALFDLNDDNYAYFSVAPKDQINAHYVKIKKDNKIENVKTQIRIPSDLYKQGLFFVGNKINENKKSSQPSIITKNGVYEVSPFEIVDVLSPFLVLVEKPIDENKMAYYLKDLRNGKTIEEVVQTSYDLGRRIQVKEIDGEKVIQVGHPGHHLFKSYQYSLGELHRILLGDNFYYKKDI